MQSYINLCGQIHSIFRTATATCFKDTGLKIGLLTHVLKAIVK
jgi:hypothetical protein